MEIRPPKYASERSVYAPEGLVTMLSEHVRVYRPNGEPDRWLFPGRGDIRGTRTPSRTGGAVRRRLPGGVQTSRSAALLCLRAD